MIRSIGDILSGEHATRLYEAVTKLGALPDFPGEAREFLEREYGKFGGGPDEFVEYVRANAAHWYRSVAEPPPWIQEAEWQYDAGRPMVYVGSVQVSTESGFFHDDATFYVFWSPDLGTTKTVIQVS